MLQSYHPSSIYKKMTYQQRVLESVIDNYLQFFPVMGLTGPRQSGKSTLLRHLLPHYTYVTFDDYRIIQLFQQDPQRFFEIYNNHVIFDEVQKIPEIFNHIKILVDTNRSETGKFVLTGSSQFSLIKNASESLAGRIGLLTLLPFQYKEIKNLPLREASLYQGGYPELVERKYAFSKEWFGSYVETYLNKDIAAIGHVGDLRDFRRLLQLLAANTSQQLNMSRYANDIGVDVKTIKRWITILEASYIIFLIPPFYDNYGKRITKSPKIYFYDVGLVSFLTGIENQTLFEQGPLAGALFENYVISEILKKEKHTNTGADFYYYRTASGVEVDLIIDRKHKRELIEIKNSATFYPKMLDGIHSIMREGDKGYLLYRGKTFPYLPPVFILPYSEYLS